MYKFHTFINSTNFTQTFHLKTSKVFKMFARSSRVVVTHQHKILVFLFDNGSVEKPRAGMSDVFWSGKVIPSAAHAFVTSSAKPQAGNGNTLRTKQMYIVICEYNYNNIR